MREAGESKYDFSSTSLLKTRPTNNRSQSGKKRSSDPPRKVSDELSLSVTTEVKSIGYVNSVDWNGGMERWIGLLEWSTGLDYWNATPTNAQFGPTSMATNLIIRLAEDQ